MEYILIIGTIVVAHTLAVISPGPDFVVVVKSTLTSSRRAGFWTAVGIGGGLLIHIIYSLAGLAVIISQSIVLFSVIKYIGAAYLLYLGYQLLISKSSSAAKMEYEQQDISSWKAVREGFLTNVLNPKATLFFLSLFTVVVGPETPLWVSLVASVIMIVNTICWFMLVSVLLSSERTRKVFLRYENPINKVLGSALGFLGVKVAFS